MIKNIFHNAFFFVFYDEFFNGLFSLYHTLTFLIYVKIYKILNQIVLLIQKNKILKV